MADLTVTVKSSGGNYTSLSQAFSSVDKDLVGNSRILTIECYDLGAADTSAVTGSGWNTNSSYYLRVVVPSAERHSGIWSTSKYRIVSAAEYAPVVICEVGHSEWVGLQIHQTSTTTTGATAFRFRYNSTTNFTRLINCIIRGEDGSTSEAIVQNRGGVGYLHSCLIYGAKPYGVKGEYDLNSAPFYLYGSTICASVIGVNANGGYTYQYNCYSGGHSSGDYVGTYLSTMVNCGSSDATGSAATRNIAKSTSAGAYFTNVTPGSENFNINTGSALIDAGSDQSGIYTVDCAGTTITGTYDIGAFAYNSGGGPVGQPFHKRFGAIPFISQERLAGYTRW